MGTLLQLYDDENLQLQGLRGSLLPLADDLSSQEWRLNEHGFAEKLGAIASRFKAANVHRISCDYISQCDALIGLIHLEAVLV